MNKAEKLEQEAADQGVNVDYFPFRSELGGLYVDGNIAIKPGLSIAERTCVLAEEICHHELSSGNILDQSDGNKRKQERIARTRSYERLITLDSIINGFEHGCRNRYEFAEFLEVTEECIESALDFYKQKYGTLKRYNKYLIMFDSGIGIMKLF